MRILKIVAALSSVASGLAGPYYFAYDCPNNCCDNVTECANVPGSSKSEQTREELLACFKAVPPSCIISAHVGFVFAGFDVYLYRVLDPGDKGHAAIIGISFEDLYRAFPDISLDPIGNVWLGKMDPKCKWVDACLPYGTDNKSAECLAPDLASDNEQKDLRVAIWQHTANGTSSNTYSGYAFNANRMQIDYSHLLIWVDRASDAEASEICDAELKETDGSSIYATVTGIIKNIREDMIKPVNIRLGTPTSK